MAQLKDEEENPASVSRTAELNVVELMTSVPRRDRSMSGKPKRSEEQRNKFRPSKKRNGKDTSSLRSERRESQKRPKQPPESEDSESRGTSAAHVISEKAGPGLVPKISQLENAGNDLLKDVPETPASTMATTLRESSAATHLVLTGRNSTAGEEAPPTPNQRFVTLEASTLQDTFNEASLRNQTGEQGQKANIQQDLHVSDITLSELREAEAAPPPKKRDSLQSRLRHDREFQRKLVLPVVYHLYLVVAIARTWCPSSSWCEGVRLLTAFTIGAYVFYGVSSVILWQTRHGSGGNVSHGTISPPSYFKLDPGLSTKNGVIFLLLGVAGGLLLMDAFDNPFRLQSISGLPILVFIGYMCSANRKAIPWMQVLNCVSLQYLVAVLTLRWERGHAVLMCIARKITQFLEFSRDGSEFVFGYLVKGINISDYVGDMSENLTDVKAAFIFDSISVMFYVTFWVNLLYYFGLMQLIIMRLALILSVTTGTTGCESISVVANIFLGMMEASLMVCPYLPTLTKAELHCVMVGGFSTINSILMAAYISLGISANHLLTASFISAPAALAYSKLVYPETDEAKSFSDYFVPGKGTDNSALEAASRAAVVTLFIMGSMVANIVAFLAFQAFINQTLLWCLANIDVAPFTFEDILGCMFTPFAAMMGVPWVDCPTVGQLIGIKILANEFIAFLRLISLQSQLQPRSLVIATYALCGFGNLGSIGITLGGLGTLCPPRLEDITELAVRAMWAGTAASFMTGCVAGSLVD